MKLLHIPTAVVYEWCDYVAGLTSEPIKYNDPSKTEMSWVYTDDISDSSIHWAFYSRARKDGDELTEESQRHRYFRRYEFAEVDE